MGPAARLGTALHSFAERVVNQAGKLDLDVIAKENKLDEGQRAELSELAQSWTAAYERHDNDRAEVAYAYDPTNDTARELGVGLARYEVKRLAKPHELTMILDLVRIDGDTVTVKDWKTGRQSGMADAEDHTQLRVGALAASRAAGLRRAGTELVRVTATNVYPTTGTLDDMELDAVAAEVAGWSIGIPSAEPNPGGWCAEKWCPLRAVCPSTIAAVESLAPSDKRASLVVVTDQAAITGPAHAAFILHRLRAIDAMRDKAWEALKGYVVTNGPVPIGDGKEYRMTTSTRESVDGKAALTLAKAKGATEYELGKCIKTATVTSAREAKLNV